MARIRSTGQGQEATATWQAAQEEPGHRRRSPLPPAPPFHPLTFSSLLSQGKGRGGDGREGIRRPRPDPRTAPSARRRRPAPRPSMEVRPGPAATLDGDARNPSWPARTMEVRRLNLQGRCRPYPASSSAPWLLRNGSGPAAAAAGGRGRALPHGGCSAYSLLLPPDVVCACFACCFE
ncbi:hypothetical protein ACQJBY_057011 [Aegilops geniculata]